jgi:hypothetical protein
VEYHKQKLFWGENPKLKRWLNQYAPVFINGLYDRWEKRKWAFHRHALVQLGYLETRVILVSNRAPIEIAQVVCAPLGYTHDSWRIDGIHGLGTNTITIMCPPDHSAIWETAIRKADAPGVPKADAYGSHK